MLRRKKSKRTQKRKYQEYLTRMGIEKDKTDVFVPMKAKPVRYVRPGSDDAAKCKSIEDSTSGALTKTGIMKDYHKLTEKDREIVNYVATCTMPLHKGHYTYVSEGMNPAEFGRKNEVL